MNRTAFYFVSLFFLLFCSCIQDQLLRDDADVNEVLSVKLEVQITPLTQPQGKDLSGAENEENTFPETRSYRGIVFQFDNSGRMLHISQPTSVEIQNNTELLLPLFDLVGGDNQTLILFIAPESIDFSELTNVNTLSELETRSVKWNGAYNSDKSPLRARLDGISVSRYGITSTNGSSVFQLKRLGCRIDFNYAFKVPGYTLKEIRIGNIPVQMQFGTEAAIYPQLDENASLTEFSVTPQSTEGSYQWYIPANARGEGSNTSGDQKLKIAANAPDPYCTLLQIACQNNNNPNEIVVMNLFLGYDAINDFNLKANHAYRVTANLNNLNEDDLRVEGLGVIESWLEVMDLNKLHGNKKIHTIRYTLSNGSTRSFTVSRTSGNRYFYKLPVSDTQQENKNSPSIRKIELLDQNGYPLALNTTGLHKIPGEGDVLIPYESNFLKDGFFYSWILQGHFNKADQYEVCSGRTLSNVRRILNGDFKQVSPVNMEYTAAWEPIGDASAPFVGRYVGDGYPIEGIVWPNEEKDAMGLFGYIRYAVIDGVTIGAENRLMGYARAMGAIVGNSSHSSVTRCSNHTRIFNGIDFNPAYTGGIIGILKGGYFKNCYNMGELSNYWYYKGAGGGIAGYVEQPEAYLENCYNVGILYNFHGNDSSRGAIIGKGNLLQTAYVINCYTHWDSFSHLIGTPSLKGNALTDHSGLGPYNNQGMKDDIFADVLNNYAAWGEWSRNDAKNHGYPYLRIERE
ncbi:MAG: hypothetical protein RR202_09580 [Bacteroidales bacterium]